MSIQIRWTIQKTQHKKSSNKQKSPSQTLTLEDNNRIRNKIAQEFGFNKIDFKQANTKTKTKKTVKRNSFDLESSRRVEIQLKRRNSDPILDFTNFSIERDSKRISQNVDEISGRRNLQKRKPMFEMKSLDKRFIIPSDQKKIVKSNFSSKSSLLKEKRNSSKTNKPSLNNTNKFIQPIGQKFQPVGSLNNSINLSSRDFRSTSTINPNQAEERISRRFNSSLEDKPQLNESKNEISIQNNKKLEMPFNLSKFLKHSQTFKRATPLSSSFKIESNK